ncbi:MAG: NERD domain-containing protein [bacterium]|nr:NERD domain-containing protein [bacterium]MDE0416705.1 NERD domain-containing protein [bacterium]
MARIVPSDVDRLALAGGHASELVTLERLRRDLDPHLTVFHSVHWTRESGDRTSWGEADFIVVNRAGKILVMEQKNGSLDETGDGLVKRYRDGASNPVLQVRRSVDNIKGKFRRVHRREPALVADYLVYCPDHRVQSVNAVGLDSSRIVDAAGDHLLVSRIHEILDDDDDAPERRATVEAFLRQSLEIYPDIHARVRHGEQRFARLSGQLSQLIAGIEMTPLRLRVRGAAGCGKTVMATRFFDGAVKRARKPLLVCFNRQLKERIAVSVAGSGLVETWHGLCHRFLEDIGKAPDFRQRDDFGAFWSHVQDEVMAAPVPDAWMFDTLIVDEGQDFEPEWFDILRLFARDDADILWLEDPDQGIRRNEPVTLEGFVGFNIRSNYRSPGTIARFIDRALPFDFEKANGLPGLEVGVEVYEDTSHQVKLVSRTVSRLLADRFRPEDVVILSMKGIRHTCLADRSRVGNHTLKNFSGEYDLLGNQVFTPGQILLESIYRYKGQQAPAIIAIDIESDGDDEGHLQRLLYTMFSRATVRLDVLVRSGDPLETRLVEAAG